MAGPQLPVNLEGRTPTGFEFDTPIDRRGTGSLKQEKYKDWDVIPLGVADMNFKAPALLHRGPPRARGQSGYQKRQTAFIP